MSPSAALSCPQCNAEISPDLRSCTQCGADVGKWPESQRAPLILPGNPAFSADVVRKRVSIPTIVFGTTAVVALLGSVLYFMPERDVEDLAPLTTVAVAPESSAGVAASAPMESVAPTLLGPDSLAAFSLGDSALSRPIAGVVAPTAAEPPTDSAPPAAAAAARSDAAARRPAATARPARSPAPSRPVAPTRPSVAPARTPARPVAAPLLAITPLVSSILRPGERVQLRWTVVDRRTRRPLPATGIEFTSTDATVATVHPTNGLVMAMTPGTARIIIDGDAAGQRTVALTVRAPAPSTVVTVAPTPGADLSRSTAASAPPPAIATPTPAPTAARESPRVDLPDAGELRSTVDRFVGDVRRNVMRNVEVAQFLSDGADHRVTLLSGPTVVSTTGMGVRIAFTMRFTKFDGGGRPVSRVAPVTMDVDKRDGSPSSSAVVIGALRRQ